MRFSKCLVCARWLGHTGFSFLRLQKRRGKRRKTTSTIHAINTLLGIIVSSALTLAMIKILKKALLLFPIGFVEAVAGSSQHAFLLVLFLII